MECKLFPLSEKEAERAGIKYLSEYNKAAGFLTRLRQLRSEAKISQQRLAEEIGVTKSTFIQHQAVRFHKGISASLHVLSVANDVLPLRMYDDELINPALGHIKVKAIRPIHVQRFISVFRNGEICLKNKLYRQRGSTICH